MLEQLHAFFISKDIKEDVSNIVWNDDWEYYNQFSCQLARESHYLISFENTNGYVQITTCPDTLKKEVSIQNIDLVKLANTLEQHNGMSRYLVMHVSLWCLDTTHIGHSCLFIFCPKSHNQWFFDPSGIMDTSAWQHISSQSLVHGYTPQGITPCHAFQFHVENIIGAKQNSICGIICSIINLQFALSYETVNDVMYFWKTMVEIPLYWEHVKYCYKSFIAMYQTTFVDGDDNDLILNKNHL
jgi:hypothetical protein